MYNTPMKNMTSRLADETLEFISKWGAWVTYIFIGLVGKFGWDIINRKKMSFWYIFGTGMVAIFVGYLSTMWCSAHCPAQGAYIVPVCTLVSRDIMLFLTMLDWPSILHLVLNKRED